MLGADQRALRDLLRGVFRRLGLFAQLDRADASICTFRARPRRGDYAIKKGMPLERTRVRGNLMRPRAAYWKLIPSRSAAQLSGSSNSELRPDLFTVFLATGGNGANNHFELLPALLPHADRCQAIVICGETRRPTTN